MTLRGLLLVGLLSVLCHGQASREVSVEDFGVENAEPAADKELVSTCRALNEARTRVKDRVTFRNLEQNSSLILIIAKRKSLFMFVFIIFI